jgi:hypothetical protein
MLDPDMPGEGADRPRHRAAEPNQQRAVIAATFRA